VPLPLYSRSAFMKGRQKLRVSDILHVFTTQFNELKNQASMTIA
jgi:hypothetical protein